MQWIPISAWIAAVVIAVVILGFCAYEISWKAKRLRADLGELQSLAGQVTGLQAGVAAARERLAASGLG